MSDEFEDTGMDTGSDMSDSGESFDDSSMDTGDEPVDDAGMDGMDDSGMDDAGMDDSGDAGMDDAGADDSEPVADDGAYDLPDGDDPTEGAEESDEDGETPDEGVEDLPDGDAEGTDETADNPDENADEPVNENAETPDESANDLPEDDEQPADGADEPVDENAEATDNGAEDLPDGDAEKTDEPADENSEATDDGANDLPEGDEQPAEGADEPVDENAEATDNGAEDLPDGDAPAKDGEEKMAGDGSADQKMDPQKAEDLKSRLKDRQEHPENYPDKQSGYKDFDDGKRNVLTDRPSKLSSKNFDRLAEARGLSPEEAANQKYSMNEYQRPDPSLNGAEHHPNKSPEDYATARHVLEPEKAYNYNNGMPKDGYEHASSGVYQTPEIQSAPNMSEQAAAQENLALPQSNDARVRSDSTLNPTLDNGKQHNVIEGTAAPQNTESVNEAFKANDGLDRHGGGKQIITDGGYGSGAVTEGAQHNIGDMNTDLNNPHLFDNHPAGEYGYTNAPDGKSGFGQLDNSQKGIRDANAQRMAGGSDRRPDDDGGHYIANMFNGDSGNKNLDAQNRNLNRGDWKAMENRQNEMLNNGDKVFTNNRSVKLDGSDRPDSYDAYTIVEHQDGSREAIPYHFQNEAKKK